MKQQGPNAGGLAGEPGLTESLRLHATEQDEGELLGDFWQATPTLGFGLHITHLQYIRVWLGHL